MGSSTSSVRKKIFKITKKYKYCNQKIVSMLLIIRTYEQNNRPYISTNKK